MRLKRFVSACVCILCFFSVIFAGGKKETEEKSVANKQSWKESFDINNKKAGKYNIVVTAEDEGGNVSFAGPMNIYIDPESDLPVTGITNPLANMRVPGNLNIVGTCIDDDAVDHVEIVLDDNSAAPVTAEGKEFWSYYLDTTQLSEGMHTIEVAGVDINGVRGHSKKVSWHLDRHEPVTVVKNYGMGQLVSGKIKLTGSVSDGNGIKNFAYSLDGGGKFLSVPLKEIRDKETNTSLWTFELSVDTKLLDDGPAVCWFKAVDMQGTKGLGTFLFFIDNTSPEVKIVSPVADAQVNGKFSAAGYAKDAIGIGRLDWTFLDQSGSIELVAGNPFWCLDLSVLGSKEKYGDLIITAQDTLGNISQAKSRFFICPEADLAVVDVRRPSPAEILYGDLILEGIAHDDDGIAQILYKIDNGTQYSIKSDGVFAYNISEYLNNLGEPLEAGEHSIFVQAVDSDGTIGTAAEIPFIIAGKTPAFGNVVVSGKNTAPRNFLPGIEINPESDSVISMQISSVCGIVSYKYQFAGCDAQEMQLQAPVKGIYPISIVVPDARWGYTELVVSAEDIFGRNVAECFPLYITDLSKTRGSPAVVFADSSVDENGIAVLNNKQNVTGYFIGGTAASARIFPETSVAAVKLSGNLLIVEQGAETGVSEPAVVEVTTADGIVYASRELRFVNPAAAPVVTIEGNTVRSGLETVPIRGFVQSDAKNIDAAYRIIRMNGTASAAGEWIPVPLSGANKSFSFDLLPELFKNGMYIVEVKAVDECGTSSLASLIISAVQEPLASTDGKNPAAAAPVFSWFENGQLYYSVAYAGELQFVSAQINGMPISGDLHGNGGVISEKNFPAGNSSVVVTVSAANGKTYVSRYTVKKNSAGAVYISQIAGKPYCSGMEVFAHRNMPPQNGTAALAVIDTADTVVSASYRINGGAEQKVPFRKAAGSLYEFDIPLDGLFADITRIDVSAQFSDGAVITSFGYISIVREKNAAEISEHQKIYWKNFSENTAYNLSQNDFVTGFADFGGKLFAEFEKPEPKLSVSVSGRQISVMPLAEGNFSDVVVVVTDGEGIKHRSPPFSVSADFSRPSLEISEPSGCIWAQDSVTVRGIAYDHIALKNAAFSIDGGNSWTDMRFAEKDLSGKMPFEIPIDISMMPDGLVEIYLRIEDAAGKTAEKIIAVHKDTKAPEIEIIVPEKGVSVNGETRVVFRVSDAGRVLKHEYAASANAPEKTADTAEKKQTERRTNFVSAETAADKDTGSPDQEDSRRFGSAKFIETLVGTKNQPLASDMCFVFTDAAGNEARVSDWPFIVDAESDKPVAEIHVPAEMEVIQTDFIVSGIVYDDDGPGKIWYKIDDSEFIALGDAGNSFSIPVALSSLSDNEHTVTVFAEDIHGVRGDMVVRTFRVSLEEPKASVLLPAIDQTVRGRVKLSGVSSDKNGIEKVLVSLDNGNTYNDASGTENWEYEFDSRIIPDGTHVVFLKVFDCYGIEGLYSSLITVDNTEPEIRLELPLDGAKTTGTVFFSGQTTDNIGLAKLYLNIRAVDMNTPKVPEMLSYMEFEADEIITQAVDISALADGIYNFEISGEDAGGNVRRVSRNIELAKAMPKTKIDILYPLNGEHVQGVFNLYGKITSEIPLETLFLFIDGEEAGTADISRTGYYKFVLSPELLTAGTHEIFVRGITEEDTIVTSGTQSVVYTPAGPWITIDNFTMGDFAVDRPYIEGSAGYAFMEAELLALRSKETSKERYEELSKKAVDCVEISFDNGKTFSKIGTTLKWRYRVENTEISEGYHFLIVRARMKNGEQAVTRTIVQIDKTAPYIKLISPGEGGRFNQIIDFAGLTSDDVALKNVTLALRSGDKAAYEVPAFIQGLYFDWHFWGATLYDIGVGLTFFDDNVKLQVQFGQMTKSQYDMLNDIFGKEETNMRYGGNVFGAKLLANVGYVPFRYFFGPNWEWLSASFALGANFSNFSLTQSGKSQMLSAVLAQIEFPRVSLKKQKSKVFRTFSLYTELQLWFIPTDVSSSVDIDSIVFQVSGGIRVNVF